MKHFTPALPARDAAKNAREFVKENKDIFQKIINPVIPYLLGLSLLDALVTGLYFPDSERGFQLGAFISSYFIASIMINWHRVVIEGPDRWTPMDLFKPKKHELAFIFGPFLLAFGFGLGSALLIGLTAVVAAPLAVLIGIVVVCVGVVGAFRISFYLPGKAINADMTFKKSWTMSKGYIWKMLTAGFLATWRVALVATLYVFAAVIVAGIIGGILSGGTGLMLHFLIFVAMIPFDIFFQPLIAVLGVTVVSNYYQWAINNPKKA
jgi:hypothetical protein